MLTQLVSWRDGQAWWYANHLLQHTFRSYIWLLIAYTQAKFDNLPTAFLNQLKEEISNGP